MNVCPTAGQSANVGVLAEPVLAPNAAVSEKLRPLSRSTAKEDTQATAPLPVRRSSRNRGVSDDPDKEPNRSLSQLSNEEISPPSVKRTLGAKTTRSSDPCDAGKTSINVEEQWDLPSKSHEGEDVPSTSGSNAEKLPTKRSRGRPRVSSSEAVEESSWSNPKALKKKIQANRSSIGSLQVGWTSNDGTRPLGSLLILFFILTYPHGLVCDDATRILACLSTAITFVFDRRSFLIIGKH